MKAPEGQRRGVTPGYPVTGAPPLFSGRRDVWWLPASPEGAEGARAALHGWGGEGGDSQSRGRYSRYSMYLPCFWFLDGRYKDSWTNFASSDESDWQSFQTDPWSPRYYDIRPDLVLSPSKNQKQGRYIIYQPYIPTAAAAWRGADGARGRLYYRGGLLVVYCACRRASGLNT